MSWGPEKPYGNCSKKMSPASNISWSKKPYFQYKMCVFGPNFYHKVASINLFYYKPMNCNSFCVITKIKLIIERVTWSKIPKNCKKHIFS